MSELLRVTVQHADGRVLFVGFVPEDDVRIRREVNRPTTCAIRMPLHDSLATLTDRPVNPDAS